MNIVIVTGASSGMGRETVRQLDKIYTKGIDEIWLIARRRDRLEELAKELDHSAHILDLDLTNEDSFAKIKAELELLSPTVKMLVNASGYGRNGNFSELNLDEQLGMIKLNCYALTYMTGIVLPYMPNGARIIQYASSAAFVPQIGFGVYAATKSFVLSFSESLNTELKDRNISVTAVCPGPVDTEFLENAGNSESGVSQIKKLFIAKEAEVVKLAIADSYKRKTISVYSLPMKAFRMMSKSLPEEMVLYTMEKINGWTKKDEE